MESGSQDRNLPASERKLKKARDDGQVSRSEDLSHIAVLGAGALSVLILAPILFERLQQVLSQQLSFNATVVMQPAYMLSRLSDAVAIGLAGCAAFAAIISGAAIAAAVASGGWVQSFKPLAPDFSRINPLSGFGNLFTKKKLLSVLKMSVMTAILFSIAASFLNSGWQSMAALMLQPSGAAIRHLTDWLTSGMGLLLLVVLLAALIDVPLQKFLHMGEMKMSHQEVKEEGKSSDGNPQIKQRIRAGPCPRPTLW